jgi:hypothetical protein
MNQNFDRGGKLPLFDGDAKNFASLWKKFMAYATRNKFRDILKETWDKNLTKEEVSEDDEKLTKEKRITITKNEVAMASFTMAFTTNKAVNLVFAAATEGLRKKEKHILYWKISWRSTVLLTLFKRLKWDNNYQE